jgi:hypothetical protein
VKVASIECGAVSISQIPGSEQRDVHECSWLRRKANQAQETKEKLVKVASNTVRTHKGELLHLASRENDLGQSKDVCIVDRIQDRDGRHTNVVYDPHRFQGIVKKEIYNHVIEHTTESGKCPCKKTLSHPLISPPIKRKAMVQTLKLDRPDEQEIKLTSPQV